MKILFLTIHFSEYINLIKNKMIELYDAEVDLLYTDNYLINPSYILDRITMGNYRKICDYSVQKSFFKKHAEKKYDIIFVLVGRNLNIEAFSDFIYNQKKAKKVLYLWDDIKRIDTFKSIKGYFDRIYSFDTEDCEKYSLIHLPLFYCDNYEFSGEKKVYDVSSIGWLHSERYNSLVKIKKQCIKNNYRYYLFLKTTFLHYIRMKSNKQIKDIEIIGYIQKSIKECSDIAKQSKVVVDLPFKTQSGLTIRTFETLAARAKLVTTNAAIKKYDFYNEQNIYVVENNLINIPQDFVNTPFIEYKKTLIEQYSLKNWIRAIIEGV